MILPPNLKIGKHVLMSAAVWYNSARDIPVHGNDGGLVRVEVDEPVPSRLPSELVCHDLDADHTALTHHVHGILKIWQFYDFYDRKLLN